MWCVRVCSSRIIKYIFVSFILLSASLVEAGAEEEEVEAILESFAEATDEMFEQVVALKKNALKKTGVKKDEEEEEAPASAEEVAEEVEAEEVLETEAEETDEAAAEAEAEIVGHGGLGI